MIPDLNPEFDYNLLSSKLRSYGSPRSKITTMLKSREIIRVKKGIYVLGPDHKKPYSLEVLANLIYGPSYISLEYALSLHGLIPERVHLVTSICSKRKKVFKTPVGDFEYFYQSKEKCAVSLERKKIDLKRSYLIASPEKSLIEKLIRSRELQPELDLENYLVDNLRISLHSLRKLRIGEMKKINLVFKQPIIDSLIILLRRLNK